jgi:HAD superfamily hydrolase (TIGR01509 family)
MIKAIFWDNDGVLVETEHLYFKATQHALSLAGIPLTEEQYIELFLVQGRGAWHLAEEKGATPTEIDRLRKERNAFYARLLLEAPRLVAGIADVLDELRDKYIMGIVTSSRKDHFDLIHQSTGLLKYFDFVLTADDYARTKPDPDPYLEAIERSGVDRTACVAVEDSERGLESATRAGIRCIIVPTSLTRCGRFVGAHHVLGSVSEIPPVLLAAADFSDAVLTSDSPIDGSGKSSCARTRLRVRPNG